MTRVYWKPSNNDKPFNVHAGPVGSTISSRSSSQLGFSEQKSKLFEETHTKEGELRRWGCKFHPGPDTLANAQAASDYYDCLTRNDPANYPAINKPVAVARLVLLRGSVDFEESSGPEACPASGGNTGDSAASTSVWVPIAIGAGILVAGGIAAAVIMASRPSSRLNPAPRKGRKGGVMLANTPANIEKHLIMGDEVHGRTQSGSPHGYFIRVIPEPGAHGSYLFQVSLKADFNPVLQTERFDLRGAATHMSYISSASQGLTWHRPAKQNPAKGKAVAKHGGYKYAITYDVVTPESAEVGDYADSGWEREYEDSGTFKSLADLLHEVGNEHSWGEWSSSHPHPGAWINSYGDTNYRDGSETTYSLHIRHADGTDLTRAELRYVNDTLDLRGHFDR